MVSSPWLGYNLITRKPCNCTLLLRLFNRSRQAEIQHFWPRQPDISIKTRHINQAIKRIKPELCLWYCNNSVFPCSAFF